MKKLMVQNRQTQEKSKEYFRKYELFLDQSETLLEFAVMNMDVLYEMQEKIVLNLLLQQDFDLEAHYRAKFEDFDQENVNAIFRKFKKSVLLRKKKLFRELPKWFDLSQKFTFKELQKKFNNIHTSKSGSQMNSAQALSSIKNETDENQSEHQKHM